MFLNSYECSVKSFVLTKCEHREIRIKCFFSPGVTSCDCDTGYEGPLCYENIDNCDPDPCNGGTCQDETNGYKCVNCPNGFNGPQCENNINDCSGNPCENSATCEDLTGDYVCHCLDGYSGKDCETDINECDPNLCFAWGSLSKPDWTI